MAGYVVTGAAVVLQLRGGGERYLYRGAPIPENVYKQASIDHAIALGFVDSVPDVQAAVVEVIVPEDEKAAAAAESTALTPETTGVTPAAQVPTGTSPAVSGGDPVTTKSTKK